jgi:hypothetical protein
MGEITEDQMKKRLGIRESITEAGEDVNKAVIPGDVKMKLQRALDILDTKKLTYPQKLQVMGRVLDALGIDKKELSKVSTKLRSKLEIKENSPCWKGYEQIGMKTKGGKEVPNCVPKK